MTKSLHFDFYDAGAYDGETEHRIMCNFYGLRDGVVCTGQSQLVKASEWQTYRAFLEAGGWVYRHHVYAAGRA